MEILVVEDDPVTRSIETRMLSRMGPPIPGAANGQEAWELYQKDRFPVVISDWNMPEMDGIELCNLIRQQDALGYTYFILVTARDSRDDRNSAMEAGADDFLIKPFDQGDLRVC